MPWKTGAKPGEHPERRSLLCPTNALGRSGPWLPSIPSIHLLGPISKRLLRATESKCLRKNSCSKLGHKRPNHCCRCGKLRDSYPQRLQVEYLVDNGKKSSRICLLWAVDTTEDIHYGRSACFRHSLTEHWTSDSERIGHKTQPTTQLNMVGCSCGWSARLAVGWVMLSNFAVSKLQLLKTHTLQTLSLSISSQKNTKTLSHVCGMLCKLTHKFKQFAVQQNRSLPNTTWCCRDLVAKRKAKTEKNRETGLPCQLWSRYAKYPKDFLWAPSPMRLFDDVLCGFSFHGLGSKQLQDIASTSKHCVSKSEV